MLDVNASLEGFRAIVDCLVYIISSYYSILFNVWGTVIDAAVIITRHAAELMGDTLGIIFETMYEIFNLV